MRVFHDSDRNRWELKLTLGAAKRVFDETGVDLLNPTKIGTDGRAVLQKLVTGDLLVGGVVFAMIGDQIRERKLDKKEVYDAFDAATITATSTPFWRSCAIFLSLAVASISRKRSKKSVRTPKPSTKRSRRRPGRLERNCATCRTRKPFRFSRANVRRIMRLRRGGERTRLRARRAPLRRRRERARRRAKRRQLQSVLRRGNGRRGRRRYERVHSPNARLEKRRRSNGDAFFNANGTFRRRSSRRRLARASGRRRRARDRERSQTLGAVRVPRRSRERGFCGRVALRRSRAYDLSPWRRATVAIRGGLRRLGRAGRSSKRGRRFWLALPEARRGIF